MTTRIVILGAGPGGYVAAVRAAQLGAAVTVVEDDNPGGTCLNWGCIPSKVMITTAQIYEQFKKAADYGIAVEGEVRPDMPRLMARKRKVIQDQIKGILGLFDHHRIEFIRGRGCLQGLGRAVVETTTGERLEVGWDRLIVATGTSPLEIPAFGFDGQRILSSNHALSLEALPASILIVGGGVIGCEFACMLSALGVRVTVVEALDRLLPLPSVDPACSKVLLREMKKRKIRVLVNRTVTAVDRHKDGLRVAVGPSPFLENPSPKDLEETGVEVACVLVAVGRRANSAGIGLETIGLETDRRGWIAADDHMATDVENVFAIGDILGPDKIMLAHVASAEAAVAAENAMGANRTMDYGAVPGAIFTLPEVATVGLSESQARERRDDVRADTVLFRTLAKAQVLGEIAGEAKIVSDVVSGRIYGVHMIGPHVTDLIAEATLAVRLGLTVQDLANTIHAHPTLGEIMVEAAYKSLDRALHG